MDSIINSDTYQNLIRPINNRKVFHLLDDRDAFLGQAGDILFFLNDCNRLVIKISSLKLIFKEGLFLHLISQKTHWVVVFNNNCDDLIFHPALAAKISNLDKYLHDHE